MSGDFATTNDFMIAKMAATATFVLDCLYRSHHTRISIILEGKRFSY